MLHFPTEFRDDSEGFDDHKLDLDHFLAASSEGVVKQRKFLLICKVIALKLSKVCRDFQARPQHVWQSPFATSKKPWQRVLVQNVCMHNNFVHHLRCEIHGAIIKFHVGSSLSCVHLDSFLPSSISSLLLCWQVDKCSAWLQLLHHCYWLKVTNKPLAIKLPPCHGHNSVHFTTSSLNFAIFGR